MTAGSFAHIWSANTLPEAGPTAPAVYCCDSWDSVRPNWAWSGNTGTVMSLISGRMISSHRSSTFRVHTAVDLASLLDRTAATLSAMLFCARHRTQCEVHDHRWLVLPHEAVPAAPLPV